MMRILGLYLAAATGALIGAFLATPYVPVDEDTGWPDVPGKIDMGAAGCCPYEDGPMQPALLYVPPAMQDGESYLIVLVASATAPADSLRAIGDSLLGQAQTGWDTVQVPMTDHLVVHLSGQRFHAVAAYPEERRGLARRRHQPTVWAWEVEPTAPGRLRLFIGGNAWPDSWARRPAMSAGLESVGLYFFVRQVRITVEKSWGARVKDFFDHPAVKLLGSSVVLGMMWQFGAAWAARRGHRAAGFRP